VHADIVEAGQTGVVQVKIVAAPAAFAASTRHGVASAAFGAWPGAYRIMR
jgi:hypothetical protein